MGQSIDSKVVSPQSVLDALNNLKPVMVNITLPSASAGTAQIAVANSALLSGQKFYLIDFIAKVNGATAWATTLTKVDIKDNNNNSFVSIPIASLTANALILPGSASLTISTRYSLNLGSDAGFGMKVIGDANAGSGSDLVVTLFGFIK